MSNQIFGAYNGSLLPLYSKFYCSSKYTGPSRGSPNYGMNYVPLTSIDDLLDSSAYCHNVAYNLASLINSQSGMVSVLHTSHPYRVNLLYTLLPMLGLLAVVVVLSMVELVTVKDPMAKECLWVLLANLYASQPAAQGATDGLDESAADITALMTQKDEHRQQKEYVVDSQGRAVP
jgi:hypothetical protein